MVTTWKNKTFLLNELSPAVFASNLLYIWQNLFVYLFICVLGIGACTIGATGLKFGTELGFPPLGGYSKFLGRLPPTSWAQEAKECFWKAVLPKPCISVKTLLNKSCQYSEGGVRSDQVQDLTQCSGGPSKCKEKVCCFGTWAYWVETWQGCYPHRHGHKRCSGPMDPKPRVG